MKNKVLLAAALMVAVTYIGRRDSYTDRLYGTGLEFDRGQTRALPPELARKFLKHPDQFERAEVLPEDAALTPPLDDTAATLEAAKKKADEQATKQQDLQALYDQVAQMDKSALTAFAMNNYKQTLNQKAPVPALRRQVTGFIDTYGAV